VHEITVDCGSAGCCRAVGQLWVDGMLFINAVAVPLEWASVPVSQPPISATNRNGACLVPRLVIPWVCAVGDNTLTSLCC
jgi:hypothetical protein